MSWNPRETISDNPAASIVAIATLASAAAGGISYFEAQHYDSIVTKSSNSAYHGTPNGISHYKPDQPIAVSAGTLQAYQRDIAASSDRDNAHDALLLSEAAFSIGTIASITFAVRVIRQ